MNQNTSAFEEEEAAALTAYPNLDGYHPKVQARGLDRLADDLGLRPVPPNNDDDVDDRDQT